MACKKCVGLWARDQTTHAFPTSKVRVVRYWCAHAITRFRALLFVRHNFCRRGKQSRNLGKVVDSVKDVICVRILLKRGSAWKLHVGTDPSDSDVHTHSSSRDEDGGEFSSSLARSSERI